MEFLRKKRILAIVGLSFLLLSVILPFVKVEVLWYSTTFTLIGYWEGKIILVLLILIAMFIFKDFIQKFIPQMFNSPLGRIIEKANQKFCLIPIGLTILLAIYLLVELNQPYIKFGIGFYILWLGVLLLIGHAIFYKEDNTSINKTNNQQVQQQFGQPMNQQPAQQQFGQPMNQQQVQQQFGQPMNQQPAQQQFGQPMNQQQVQQQFGQPMNQQPAQQQFGQPMNQQQAQQQNHQQY